jgi:hypothetical protein
LEIDSQAVSPLVFAYPQPIHWIKSGTLIPRSGDVAHDWFELIWSLS